MLDIARKVILATNQSSFISFETLAKLNDNVQLTAEDVTELESLMRVEGYVSRTTLFGLQLIHRDLLDTLCKPINFGATPVKSSSVSFEDTMNSFRSGDQFTAKEIYEITTGHRWYGLEGPSRRGIGKRIKTLVGSFPKKYKLMGVDDAGHSVYMKK